jgi:hypothetical protein
MEVAGRERKWNQVLAVPAAAITSSLIREEVTFLFWITG